MSAKRSPGPIFAAQPPVVAHAVRRNFRRNNAMPWAIVWLPPVSSDCYGWRRMDGSAERPSRRAAPPASVRLLPLLLIGALVVLGAAIEGARFHTLLWASKLPMIVLLAWAAVRIATSRRR